MIKYITSRPLWINIVFAVALVIILILLFILSLNKLTRHGESSSVPAVIGKNINDVEKTLGEKGFEVVVQDSVYYDSLPPGFVIRQVPEADAVVKINRTVYVTINRFVPPDVEMPNLLGSSYRNAEMVLKNLGLKIGDTSYRFDFAKNSVLEQSYNGSSIKPGTKIRVGSTVSLVLGSGLSEEDMSVPDLIGMSYEEARVLLDAQGLSGLVIVDPNVRDTASAFVYRQSPMPRTEDGVRLRIRQGQMIDVWLSLEKPVVDTIQNLEIPSPEDLP
ncbi:MAG TPA: PASTA domain-containing protein [Chitinophagaceae bacterium]|nr:PASTA domain-containing protein [Chitinophagaceae bacterium]